MAGTLHIGTRSTVQAGTPGPRQVIFWQPVLERGRKEKLLIESADSKALVHAIIIKSFRSGQSDFHGYSHLSPTHSQAVPPFHE